jgi:cold shock CspA family protein/ribosome-associated translation inhibitor RaiA
MDVPLEVSVRGAQANWEEVEGEVRRRLDKLGKLSAGITRMRVVVDSPHRRHKEGIHYSVHIEISVPGKNIVVNRERHQRASHEDLRVCMRDAFDAIRRQIEDHERIRHGVVKSHEQSPEGRVARLVPDMDHGFLVTPEGDEVYFHRNSVVGQGFDSLREGDLVRFNPENGEKGPQASSVVPLGKHHYVLES